MSTERAVRDFLRRWAEASERRDPEAYADLFLRDPAPAVTFTDGQRSRDWLDVRVRAGRDFERALVERVEVHDITVRDLTPEVAVCSFEFDLTVRDMWGVSSTATRHATMTLVRTKDGLRVAAAHFAVAR